MSTQTTLLHTRNSVETVLGESSNKRNTRVFKQGKNKKNKSTHFPQGPSRSMFATRRFSDISNFLASTDWVPFDDSENFSGSNFFSNCSASQTFSSPPTHHDRYTTHEEAMDWVCMNTTCSTNSSNKPTTTTTTTRPHKVSSSSATTLRESSNKKTKVFDLNQNIVSKQVANTWVNMGCSSSKQASIVTPVHFSSNPGKQQTTNRTKTNEHATQRPRPYSGSRRVLGRERDSVHANGTGHAYHHHDKSADRTRGAATAATSSLTLAARVIYNINGKIKDKSRPEKPRIKPSKFMSSSSSNNNNNNKVWRSAKDPKSGRTYYYNVVTRETQWRKPMELASQEEKAQMLAKEKKQRDFFAAMEANILKNISSCNITPKPEEKTKQALPTKRVVVSIPRPRMVRTISSMDENVLRDLTRVPSRRSIVSVTSSEGRRSEDSLSLRSLGVGDLDTQLDPLMESAREFEQSSTNLLGASMNFDASSTDLTLSPTPEEGKVLAGETLVKSGEASPVEELSLEELQALTALEQAAEEMKRASSTSSAPTPNSMPAGLDLMDSNNNTIKTDNVSKERKEQSPPAGTKEEEAPKKRLARPKMSKRNTCGTLYVGTTMSAPDKDATIKCVCGVYRAHILQSAKEEAANFMGPSVESDKYIVFNDYEEQRHPVLAEQSPVAIQALSLESVEKSIPTLDEITNFYRDVFRRSQMETDCIIMSLIYVERLIKDTGGALRPRVSNWRSILFSCMVLSSKVWDDLSMWNADFSQTCPAGVTLFNLKRINELEIAVLTALKYNVKVKSSEYAKYYFLLRSMIIKSGLGGEDLSSMAPLDVEGAKKLEQVSSNFSHHVKRRPSRLRATKSLDSEARSRIIAVQSEGGDSDDTSPTRERGKVSLEHVVNM